MALHCVNKNMMKLLIIFLLAISGSLFAQQKKINEKVDSAATGLQSAVDSLQIKVTTHQVDSLQDSWEKKIDSVKNIGNFNRHLDSLKVVGWADSLRTSVVSYFSSKQNAIYKQVDSLLVRNQPTHLLQSKTDSLSRKQELLLGEIGQKQSQLQQKLNARFQKWSGKLDSLKLKTPNVNAKLPGMDNASSQLNSLSSKIPNVPTANMKLLGATQQIPNAQLPGLNTADFASLNLSKDLSGVGGKLSVPSADQLNLWDKQIKGVTEPLGDVKSKMGDLNTALKDPGKAAEEASKQLKEVSTLSKEMRDADKLLKENEAMKTAEMMKDPNAMKEELAEKAVDHFAGKEQELKQAMEQMAKYKKKLPSLESLDQLPKRLWIPRNSLKGKPFRERVRFGGNIGFQNRRDTLWVDIFPNVSYKLTGSIELGTGFNYRLKWNTKKKSFEQRDPAWGFNLFGTFKTYKSVRMRVEADAFNTSRTGSVGESTQRQWRWTWLLGMQTNFNVSKNCTGSVQMLYNFDKAITAGFPEQLVLRVGIQWKLADKVNQN
jgi:hypothetical protein